MHHHLSRCRAKHALKEKNEKIKIKIKNKKLGTSINFFFSCLDFSC
jgi:hypothetical protein